MIYEYSISRVIPYFLLISVNANTHCEREEIRDELKKNLVAKLDEALQEIPFPFKERHKRVECVMREGRRDGSFCVSQLIHHGISDALAIQLLGECLHASVV